MRILSEQVAEVHTSSVYCCCLLCQPRKYYRRPSNFNKRI